MKYKITIEGSGAEITIGKVDADLKQFILDSDDDLEDIALDQLEDWGGWFEIDNFFHGFGSYDFEIRIEDETGKLIHSIKSDNLHSFYDYENLFQSEYKEISEDEDLLMCIDHQKGNFFTGEIETDNFDLNKLTIIMHSEFGIEDNIYDELTGNVSYDSKEIENIGGDTRSKQFEAFKNF